MSKRETKRSHFNAVLWRLTLVLIAIVVAFAGRYWATIQHRSFFVGSFNPSGTQFVSYNYSEAGSEFGVVPQLRDSVTGKVIHDLSDIDAAWGDSVVWLDDETLVALSHIRPAPVQEPSEETTDSDTQSGWYVATVRLDGESSTVSRKWISNRHVQSILPSGADHYCFAIAENSGTDRYLKVMRGPIVNEGVAEDPVELTRLKLGDQEEAYANGLTVTPPGTVLVQIGPSNAAAPATSKTPATDFKLTDGINPTTKLLDAVTGDVIRTITNAELINQSDHMVWRDVATGLEVYHVDDLDTPLATLPPKNQGSLYPLAINDQQLFVVERLAQKDNLRIVNRSNGTEKEFKFPRRLSLNVGHAGDIHIVSPDGTLSKFDPETGETHHIATARPYRLFTQSVAWGGIPLLLVLASAITLYTNRRMPFFDIGLACVLIALAVVAWSATRATNPVLMQWMTQTFLGATVAILLLWASTSRALFGFAIPTAIVAIALIISFYLATWSGSAGTMVEVALGAPLLIFFQTLGHALLRRYAGFIHGPNAAPESRRQFSVRQIAVTTAAIAFLFACLRFVKFDETRIPNTALTWVVSFALLYAMCVTWATWCAFKFKHLFVSALAVVLGALVFITILYVTTIEHSSLNIDATPYLQPLVAAVIVWWTLRLCIRVGYQLTAPIDHVTQ